jgi:hypothetical protein
MPGSIRLEPGSERSVTHRSHTPVDSVRLTMAIVTASLHEDHHRAHALANELKERQTRFGLLVLAEYMAQVLEELATTTGGRSDELWSRYCMRTELAIDRARERLSGPNPEPG